MASALLKLANTILLALLSAVLMILVLDTLIQVVQERVCQNIQMHNGEGDLGVEEFITPPYSDSLLGMDKQFYYTNHKNELLKFPTKAYLAPRQVAPYDYPVPSYEKNRPTCYNAVPRRPRHCTKKCPCDYRCGCANGQCSYVPMRCSCGAALVKPPMVAAAEKKEGFQSEYYTTCYHDPLATFVKYHPHQYRSAGYEPLYQERPRTEFIVEEEPEKIPYIREALEEKPHMRKLHSDVACKVTKNPPPHNYPIDSLQWKFQPFKRFPLSQPEDIHCDLIPALTDVPRQMKSTNQNLISANILKPEAVTTKHNEMIREKVQSNKVIRNNVISNDMLSVDGVQPERLMPDINAHDNNLYTDELMTTVASNPIQSMIITHTKEVCGFDGAYNANAQWNACPTSG